MKDAFSIDINDFANPGADCPVEVEIIHAVTNYQMAAPAWPCAEIVRNLKIWQERLVAEFKLQIPELAYCLEKLPVRTMGHYRGNYNGFGLRREIAINTNYVREDNFWDAIGTLAHELIHSHQDLTGTASKKKNHHNDEFRKLADMMGLVVAPNGVQTYVPNGRFFDFLTSNDAAIQLPAMEDIAEPIPQAKKKKGTSTLKKWACDCQTIRSGKAELFVRCDKPDGCGKPLRLVTHDADAPQASATPPLPGAELATLQKFD